ncbi:MAG: putative multidrug efflux pump, outer membrane protein [Clostridia bacterium]|jgi:hypothetical protein|nr:putative multidrug efflux pump, outer membrane protein [Clostridia bacterium]
MIRGREMKNYFKKLLAIMMIVPALGITPVHASEAKAVLSLNDAITSAYRYSNQISLNSKEYDLLKEQLKAQEGGSFVSYQTTYLTKAKNQQQEQILRDQIASDITKRYNGLVLLEKEIANLDASISLNTQKLEDMKLKKRVGLITSTEYNSAAIQLDIQKNSRNAKVESLANDQAYFKILTGKDLKQYSLEDKIEYETFRIQGPIDSYMSNKVDEYLKYDKDIVQLQADNILTEGSAPMPWAVYLGQKYTVDKQISGLENSQKSLKQALMTSYSSLLSLEEQIATLQEQLKLTEQRISNAKLQHNVGLITTLDYKSQLLGLQDIQCNLRKLTNSYHLLKESIQKPWTLSSGM